MSATTNRNYSSSDISSVTEQFRYRRIARTSMASGQPLLHCCTSENRSKKSESQQDSISEVTMNNTIYSGRTTPKRRLLKCKDITDEEMITYHLKLEPESLRYTFSTSEHKKIVDTDKQRTAGLPCHVRKKELACHKSSFLQNSQNGNSRKKSYEEKTTNCRPVINLHTVEFVERTIDKNNRLKHLVRDIVQAREKEKQLDAWNNYINELKNRHANDYYYGTYVPATYQQHCDNTFYHYNVPCRCTSTMPWSDDYCGVSKHSDYLMNLYPNEISCYPISSAAHRLQKIPNEPPRRQYVKTEYIINSEEQKPRKRKRRQLSNNQVRTISAQTSTGFGTSLNDTDSNYQNRYKAKDKIEGYEPCVCAAEIMRDFGTNTDKVEQKSLTDLTKNAASQACFCNKDQGIITVPKNEISTFTVGPIEGEQYKSERTATYETITEKMSKLKEELGQSKTCDNSLGIIEEKLDNIISTMHDLLSQVKLRMTDMSTEKFESATSTIFPYINDNYENCIAYKLLEQEIKISKADNAKQKERYNFDLFKRERETINTTQLYLTPTRTEHTAQLNCTPAPMRNDVAQSNVIETPSENKTQLNYILTPAEYPKENTTLLNAIPVPTENKTSLNNILTPEEYAKENTAQLNALPSPKENQTRLNNMLTSAKYEKENTIPRPSENNIQLKSILTSSQHKKLDANTISTEDTAKPNSAPITANKTDITTTNLGQTAKTHAESNEEAEVPEKLEKKSLKLVTDPTMSLIRSPGKDHLVSDVGKSDDKPQPAGEPQPATSLQLKDDRLPKVERSVIDLKKASKSFMDTLHRSGLNLTEEEINKKSESLGQRLKTKFSSKTQHAKQSKEQKPTANSIPEDDKSTEKNSNSKHPDNNKNSKRNTKDEELCCVYATVRSMSRPRYCHESVIASLDKEISNTTEINLDARYSKNGGNDQIIDKGQCTLVDRAVSKIDENIIKINGKSNNTKLRAVDRAVSKIDENLFSEHHQQSYISVDRAVSNIDAIIIEEINKSNKAKKDINKILNKGFTHNYGVQIAFELPTKERGTEVTDSLSKTRLSSTSLSKGKIYHGTPSRRTPLTIAAVNTDPMSLFGLFRLSTDTVRQLLTFINFDYSSYLPSVSRTIPAVSEAVQYLCHICGAAFRRPSELSSHLKAHNLESVKDCCVCRHVLQLRQRNPGMFVCRFCGQCFTRAYCCDLHERTCGSRRGRCLDVSDSCAILK